MSKIMREIYAEALRHRQANEAREKRRYSTDASDVEGYGNFSRVISGGNVCRVYCDGKYVERVVTADETRGEVVVCKFPYVVNWASGEMETETLRGSVLVEFVPA